MRHKIIDGLVKRRGEEHDLEEKARYTERFLERAVEKGAAIRLVETASMRDALDALQRLEGGLLLLPNSFYMDDETKGNDRALKDMTEGYDGLDYPRRVKWAAQARLKKDPAAPESVRDAAARTQALSQDLMERLGLSPTGFLDAMMAEPLPIPSRGISSPRARLAAKEERPLVGYKFTLLDTKQHVLIPWYALVEGGASVAHRLAFGKKARMWGNIVPHDDGHALVGWHDAFPNSRTPGNRYNVALNKIAFGRSEDGLAEWRSAAARKYAHCDCKDFLYRALLNTWQGPAAETVGTYRLCKHQASLAYWVQAFGKQKAEGEWQASPFLLPLVEQDGSRFSEALRLRERLVRQTLIENEDGEYVPLPVTVQSVFYGAEQSRLHASRGYGIFSEGVMTGARAHALKQEKQRLAKRGA